MNPWESLVEKKIREAIEQGEFEDLPGKGKPVDALENPFEDPELRMAHRLLRNAGFAPAWIEERKDIDAELERARTVLARALRLFQRAQGSSSADAAWQESVKAFRSRVEGLNQRIQSYNLTAPATAFQRRLINCENEIVRLERGTEESESATSCKD